MGLIVSAVIFGPETAKEYALPIVAASSLMDLDHTPYIVKHVRESFKSMKKGAANAHISGLLHKEITQMIFLTIMLIAYFLVDKTLIAIITLNAFLHFGVDALMSNNDRIFAPLSNRSLSIRLFGTHKLRVAVDAGSIPLLAIILWFVAY